MFKGTMFISHTCSLLVREIYSQHNVKPFSLAWILELGVFVCLFV